MNFSTGYNNGSHGNMTSSQGGYGPYNNNFNQNGYQATYPPQMFNMQNPHYYGYNPNDRNNFQGQGNVPFQFNSQGDPTLWNLLNKKI